ncbi:MAG: hypothetical protein HETSPECPRED_002143 [Heterodermia speciosa]|uniref:Uncharacterized protein n=1 Tax=Heterodermia speciosa TaxID=116794 RepID=A0A8H3J3J1_9LECA|nr:MAG: hypothetical protein HETSPECPRED_002143 [Heterodermia speciosa]
MAELSFFDEHLSLSFDDTTTMRIEQTETFSNNAKDVNDEMSQQFSANILGMSSSPTESITSFDFSTVSNQNIFSQHSASSLQLNGLDLRIDQPIKNNERELVSEEAGYAFSDLERELYNVECAAGDQLHQEPRINNDLAVPICSTANTPVPEFPAIMGIIEPLSDSSEHNDAQNVAEKAKSSSRFLAYDGDLVSAE